MGLVDDSLGSLPAEYSALVDCTSRAFNPPVSRAGAVFIDASPMTHDPRLTIRFTSDNRFFNAAAIYDFIPLDWPGYLQTPADRLGYYAQLARLRCFDLYCPISEYTAWRLAEVLGISRELIVVTGAAVRSRLYEIRQQVAARPAVRNEGLPYFITVGGGDRRKNTEVAVAAVRELNRGVARASLKVVGHYDDAYKSDLLQIAGHAESGGFLEFHAGVNDHTLVDLYSGAVASICPSHIEGFSLPVVESAVCGTPVIASMCGAHLELIRSDEALFQSTESEALVAKLDRVLRDEKWARSSRVNRRICHSDFMRPRSAPVSGTVLPPEWNRAGRCTPTPVPENPALLFLRLIRRTGPEWPVIPNSPCRPRRPGSTSISIPMPSGPWRCRQVPGMEAKRESRRF